jgi:hypothetical protein
MFQVPEKYRITKHSIKSFITSKEKNGNNGFFEIPLSHNSVAFIVASCGSGWEHLSAHISAFDGRVHRDRTPTWAEMCKLKDLFWTADDWCMQYHPPESEYVNNHKHTLHIWRPVGISFPTPPSVLVGFKEQDIPVQRPEAAEGLLELTQSPRSFPEDYDQENGNYLNNCIRCSLSFIGNKHRVVCKTCS